LRFLIRLDLACIELKQSHGSTQRVGENFMRHSIEGVLEILVAAASGGELAPIAGVNQPAWLAGWPFGGIKTPGLIDSSGAVTADARAPAREQFDTARFRRKVKL
jgi:hypothetical protein